jgi:hypothetical protein
MYKQFQGTGDEDDDEDDDDEEYDNDENEDDEGEEIGFPAVEDTKVGKQAEKFTADAIKKAESGDMVGGYKLFQKAVGLIPDTAKFHENLAVTQMRVGLLSASRSSFEKAKALYAGSPGAASIADNLKALGEQ